MCARRIPSVLWKVITAAFAAAGIALSMTGADGFMAQRALLYFTIQSNLWMAVTTLVCAARQLAGRGDPPRWLLGAKFAFTVSVALTFLVFFCFLAPAMSASYLLSPGNLCVHLLAPLLAVGDFLLFDKTIGRKPVAFALAALPPLIYFFVTMALSLGGVRYQNGDIAPYFFLDYAKLGWFTISAHGLGVVYWVLIMVLLVGGISLLLLWVKGKIQNRRPEGR